MTQQRGRALIEIEQPTAAGRNAEVEYGDELYRQKFDRNGLMRIAFALTAPENQFTLTLSEMAPVNCSISVPDFNKIYRAILRWHDPVQLDLSVLEPNGRLNEAGNVSSKRPNTTLREGIGEMDVLGTIPGDDATGEISYVTDEAAIPPDGVFGFKVEFVSRGAQAEAPYCGDNPLAAPRIDFVRIKGGIVSSERLTLNRMQCHDRIPENRRLMPIR